MKITILGSGTSTGVPMVGCSCPVCTSGNPRNRRTRCSILIQTGNRYILVDTSTDLRRQALRVKIPHIDAVLFTHSHADHVNGIDDLRGFHFIHKRVIPCYGDQETMEIIAGNFAYIFKGHEPAGYFPLLESHTITGPFPLFDREVVPVPLRHGTLAATGYRIGGMAYLTDCSEIPEASMALLGGLDTLIIDALRYTPHSNHFNIDGALKVAETLRPRRTVLTHLTHEVPYENGAALPAGIELAYDGMTLKI